MMMHGIERLGDDIEQAFAAAQYDERAFAEVAQQKLEQHAPHRSFDVAELVRWSYSASQIPQQNKAQFGQPPVMLYRGRRFFMEALFWLDGTTVVHEHEFSGAFQVLAGSSLHARFAFRPEVVVNRALTLGEVRPHTPELLQTGDTRAILPGEGLIHSTFHLDRPSVTLVVRTYYEPNAASQRHFLRPGIALSSFHYDARLPRVLELLEAVFRSRLDDRETIAVELLETADLHTSVLVLDKLHFIARPELERLSEVVCRRYPWAAAHVRAAVAELRRQRLITSRRNAAHDPEHRYLLALLLNLDERDDILRFVAQRVPGRDPVEQIVRWVAELSSLGEGGESDEPSAGYAFGEVELEIFRHLLEERSVDEILAALAQKYDEVADQALSVRSLCEAMQNSAMFRQLLRRPRLRAA
jgi:hypothetical protein